MKRDPYDSLGKGSSHCHQSPATENSGFSLADRIIWERLVVKGTTGSFHNKVKSSHFWPDERFI